MKVTEEQLINKIYDEADEKAYYEVESFLQDIINNPIAKTMKLKDGQNLSGFIVDLLESKSFYESKDRLASEYQDQLLHNAYIYLGL